MTKKREVKPAPKRRGLTPKQEKFCQLYIELGNASEAYRQSYDCITMKTGTINSRAKELLRHSPIAVRIEELQAEHKKRHTLTVDKVIADLEELRDICMGRRKVIVSEVDKQTGTANDVEVAVFEPVAANRALDLLGKHLGMFNQKIELSGTVTNQNVNLTKDEFKDIAKEVLSEV